MHRDSRLGAARREILWYAAAFRSVGDSSICYADRLLDAGSDVKAALSNAFKAIAAINLFQTVLQTGLTLIFAALGFGVYSFVWPMPVVYLEIPPPFG